MLPIEKLLEPISLQMYKQHSFEMGEIPSYDGFTRFAREKNDEGITTPRNATPFYKFREALLKEQKFVCAYCGQEILCVENDHGKAQMKTEHFSPQDGTTENDLDYENLLACCKGNDDKKGENHCDSMKGEGILAYVQNPATIKVRDDEIIYQVNIRQEEVLLFSSNDMKNQELIGKKSGNLNLNHGSLKEARFLVWKNVLAKNLGDREPEWPIDKVNAIKEEYSNPEIIKNPKFKDFVLWYLENWLNQNA